MMFLRFIYPLCAICFIVVAERAKIPDYIQTCKRSDPRVTRCIRNSVEALRPQLRDGIPELNVPGLEPLLINNITVFRGGDSSNFRAFLRNVNVHGASDFQLTRLKLDLGKNIYRVELKIPILRLDGDYDINARILVVPITGKGKFKANVTNVEGQGILRAELFQRDGYQQIRFTSFELAIKIGDYNIHLENLFNGDPVLGQAAGQAFRESKGELIEAAIPFIQRKVAEILLDIANQITKNIDYDEVFPEN